MTQWQQQKHEEKIQNQKYYPIDSEYRNAEPFFLWDRICAQFDINAITLYLSISFVKYYIDTSNLAQYDWFQSFRNLLLAEILL